MTIKRLAPEGLILFEPKVYTDDRGYFFESFNPAIAIETGQNFEFMQDNESCSHKNVLRGLHFQNPPFEQGKLVRVIKGSVFDVAVDIRKNSPTYSHYFGVELSEKNKKILWIPPGFAHGFVSLENDTIFIYKCTMPYNKQYESGIIWNDDVLKISWNIKSPLVSAKDLELPGLENANNLFE